MTLNCKLVGLLTQIFSKIAVESGKNTRFIASGDLNAGAEKCATPDSGCNTDQAEPVLYMPLFRGKIVAMEIPRTSGGSLKLLSLYCRAKGKRHEPPDAGKSPPIKCDFSGIFVIIFLKIFKRILFAIRFEFF